MLGIKHLIECHCYLKIFDQKNNQVNHKFPVYSKIDENDKVIPKLVKCNNCEALHYVYDICKSDLKPGKEDSKSILEKEDFIMMLPDKVANILVKNQCDISDFEHALDIIEEKAWGSHIVIKRDIVGEEHQIKLITFKDENNVKIENKPIKSIMVGEK
tara:strand:+ start:706 stop:1179 length:474 start_codon:yes stop_codon:yes gene_type:complete